MRGRFACGCIVGDLRHCCTAPAPAVRIFIGSGVAVRARVDSKTTDGECRQCLSYESKKWRGVIESKISCTLLLKRISFSWGLHHASQTVDSTRQTKLSPTQHTSITVGLRLVNTYLQVEVERCHTLGERLGVLELFYSTAEFVLD